MVAASNAPVYCWVVCNLTLTMSNGWPVQVSRAIFQHRLGLTRAPSNTCAMPPVAPENKSFRVLLKPCSGSSSSMSYSRPRTPFAVWWKRLFRTAWRWGESGLAMQLKAMNTTQCERRILLHIIRNAPLKYSSSMRGGMRLFCDSSNAEGRLAGSCCKSQEMTRKQCISL